MFGDWCLVVLSSPSELHVDLVHRGLRLSPLLLLDGGDRQRCLPAARPRRHDAASVLLGRPSSVSVSAVGCLPLGHLSAAASSVPHVLLHHAD